MCIWEAFNDRCHNLFITLVTIILCTEHLIVHLNLPTYLFSPQQYPCPVNPTSTQMLKYITYFHDESICGKFNSSQVFPEFNRRLRHEIQFPEKAPWKDFSSNLVYCYMCIDSLWMLVSLIIFIGVMWEWKRSISVYYIYITWITVGLGVIGLDFSLLLFYWCTTYNMKTSVIWLKCVGVQNYRAYCDFNDYIQVDVFKSIGVKLALNYIRYGIFFLMNCVNVLLMIKYVATMYREDVQIKRVYTRREM